MPVLFVIFPTAIFVMWLGFIRPYCIRKGKGFTAGMNPGATMWVDWQMASEMAKASNDRGMVGVCRVFLIAHLLMFGCGLAAVFF